jgi:general secretion pathway protein G
MRKQTRHERHMPVHVSLARALRRGVTLVEVMIVVAILAMVAGGVAVYAIPKYRDTQKETAKTAARTIRLAVQSRVLKTTDSGCPTVSQLVASKDLDPGQQTVDPWGEEYVISCSEEGDVSVLSKGPDKKQGTKDDIQVPEVGAAAAEAE